MALNPFFLQGSPGEQRLIQELINEQLQIYGVEVTYIPRKFVRQETIIREVTSSKFDDNFSIEAYVSNYDGYMGSGDILTKFGMSLKDELTLIISKERFEDFISPFLSSMDPEEIILSTRPREGDIVYFPLGKRLFEVKFVEHEKPFYQLGKTYVYELQCELFELEDEVSTTIEEIDSTLQSQGYMTSLQLFGSGQRATTYTTIGSGYVRKVALINDGYDYLTPPTISFTPAPNGGQTASAVAITTCKGGVCSIKEILLINPGYGYTVEPKVTITSSDNGIGAEAKCEIVKDYSGIGSIGIQTYGSGYVNSPIVTFTTPTVGLAITAVGQAVVGSSGSITQILIKDAGLGYNAVPTISIANPPSLTGIGTYKFNEVVSGSISGTTSRVKSWDKDTKVLEVGVIDGTFYPGEIVVGSASSARYSLKTVYKSQFADKYEENDQIEEEADLIVDFSESNPFGNY
tara:strand:+ start:1392 stop:2774 length:1383 start_codon:yes stop_codon:yes gene_type:complete